MVTDMTVKKKVPCVLMNSMLDAIQSPTGILWLMIHCSKPSGLGGGAACESAKRAGLPSIVTTPCNHACVAGASWRSSSAAIISLSPRRLNFKLPSSRATLGHCCA